jgi:hypothetical protein
LYEISNILPVSPLQTTLIKRVMMFNALSTIFQLYCGGQFCCWRKPEYQEKTTALIKGNTALLVVLIEVLFISLTTLFLTYIVLLD